MPNKLSVVPVGGRDSAFYDAGYNAAISHVRAIVDNIKSQTHNAQNYCMTGFIAMELMEVELAELLGTDKTDG